MSCIIPYAVLLPLRIVVNKTWQMYFIIPLSTSSSHCIFLFLFLDSDNVSYQSAITVIHCTDRIWYRYVTVEWMKIAVLWNTCWGSSATHPLSEVTNILYLLALVILTSFLLCSHWLTQSQKEADIYYLFIIGWHTIYFSSYWLNILN